MLPIAVDAMGGDFAPDEIIAGCRIAVDELDIGVILVGQPERLAEFDCGSLEIFAASEVIEMDEEAGGAVRRKKDSSLVRCAELVRDGKAAAMVSAGNTGATMASALLRMGRIKGVGRPAIATILPVPGNPTVMLDSGANSDVQPEWLVQFAQMGAAYYTSRYGTEKPRVGLLTIGEEAGKGNKLVKETYELLQAGVGINFIGNVEGRDLLTTAVDVVVTDGFTGNVALKTMEGCFRFTIDQVLNALRGDLGIAAIFESQILPALQPMIDEIGPEARGGAMLLGVDGVCVVSHGSSKRRAVSTAVSIAHDLATNDLVGKLRAAVTGNITSHD